VSERDEPVITTIFAFAIAAVGLMVICGVGA